MESMNYNGWEKKHVYSQIHLWPKYIQEKTDVSIQRFLDTVRGLILPDTQCNMLLNTEKQLYLRQNYKKA